MNERIKQLAEQAGFSFKYKTAPDEMNPGHKLKDLKKFAELIVRECAELTRWKEFDMSVEQRIRLSVYQDIKEHFGVEE